MNDFERDNEFQLNMRNRLLSKFYGKFTQGYVYLDKGNLSTILQRRYAVDTIAQGLSGSAVAIEEKIVRWPGYHYRSICLETESCTKEGHESSGWMVYGQADYLLYCRMLPGDLCRQRKCKALQDTEKPKCWDSNCTGALRYLLVPFAPLKEWFWSRADEFDSFGPLETMNGSAGRLVPVDIIRANIEKTRTGEMT